MADANNPETYPPPSNAAMNVLRTCAAYSLLAVQLAFFLFVLELPYWIADRFFTKHRGDAFCRGQRALGRWFFRLYPFGQQRLVNVKRKAFPGPCVIVCNHQSSLDMLLALKLPVNARWMVGSWPFKFPLMGELNRLCRHIQVDDDAGQAGHDHALSYLKEGVSILMFPEDSRSDDGRIHDFKNTAFALAIDAQVPVVPVIFEGSGACVRKDSPVVHHPDLIIKVLEPVSTKGVADAAELSQQVRAAMQSELASLRAARKPSYPRVHGWLTRLGMAGVAVLIALAVGVSIYVNNFCIAEPPVYDGSRALADAEIVERTMQESPVKILSDNWRRKRDGIHEIGLTGNSWERGYANARLSRDLTEEQEKFLLEKVREFLPGDTALWVAKHLVAINNRNLPDHLTDAEKLEILGLTEGSIDHYPDEAPLYHRIMNYHAAHDISHIFIDHPLVTFSEFVGCTAFAAWGDATLNGNLLIGRNFDFEAGKVFDADKAIVYVWPEGGIPYVHVAWAGMAGAVTGMNAEGISVHVNAARTDEVGFGQIGTPVSLLVKRVLEEARSINEAYKIIEQTQVFVSDTYMVASRDEKRAVVIEKSPAHCAMREGENSMILQTNHMLTDPLKDDPVNMQQIERATTSYRWERLAELLDAKRGDLNPAACQEILRDRKGRGGKDIGIGNRNAIDAAICSHSVIMNLTTGEMWVSAAPHTYGRYVYVPVLRMLEAGPVAALRMRIDQQFNLARDPRSAEYDDLVEFRKQVRFIRGFIDDDEVDKAEGALRTMRNINPKSFETSYFEGRVAYLKEDYARAEKKFEEALERDPHYEDVRAHIRQWQQQAKDAQ